MRLRGIGSAFAGSMMFGLGAVLASIVGRDIEVILVGMLALGGGGLLLIIGLLLTHTAFVKPLRSFTRIEWLRLWLMAALGTALPLLIIVAGFARTSAVEGGFLLQLNGVAALVFAVLLLHERFFGKQIIGIALLLLGSVVVVFTGAGGGVGKNDFFGDLLIFVGTIGLGYGYIPGKLLADRANTLLLTALRLTLGAVVLLPILALRLLTAQHGLFWHPTLSTLLIAMPVYIVTNFCLAYLAQQEGLRLLAAWEVAAILQTVPLFATIFAVLIQHDTLTFWQIIGGIVALAGGLIVSLNSRTPLASVKDESALLQETSVP